MNWSNAPPTILEKVMFYAAQNEKHNSTWLLAIEKFSRVSTYWKKVVFSSKVLFPTNASLWFDTDWQTGEMDSGNEAKDLVKAGFLGLVSKLFIDNPQAFQYIGRVGQRFFCVFLD